ncbi:MAG: hypothetical protein V4726_03005 [Verrucomicrobiota bacterium]
MPPSAVTDAWNELNTEDDDRLTDHVALFRQEQPILAGYLQAAEEAISSRDDRGLIFFYGLWAWLAFKKCGGATHEVTEERIEAAWDENERQMEILGAASELQWMRGARHLTRDYPQMALLGAVTESVMDPGLTDTPRTDDLSGVILLHVKTAIDSLND